MGNTIQFKNIKIATGFSVAALLFSCGTERLQPNEKLYTGAKINIINDTISKKEKSSLKDGLEDNLTPKPNSSILIVMKNILREIKIQEPI